MYLSTLMNLYEFVFHRDNTKHIPYNATHKVIYYGRFNDFTYTSQYNPPNIDDVFVDKVKLKTCLYLSWLKKFDKNNTMF